MLEPAGFPPLAQEHSRRLCHAGSSEDRKPPLKRCVHADAAAPERGSRRRPAPRLPLPPGAGGVIVPHCFSIK